MANDDLKRLARQRRADLEAELRQIDEILTILDGRGTALPEQPSQDRSAERPKPKPSSMKKAMRDAIVELGRPLSRSVVAALKEAGTPVKSKSPANYVGTMMYRWNSEFVNFSGIGYWPADLPYEPTRYVPPL